VADFESLDHAERGYETQKLRKAELLRLQRAGNPKRYKQTRKNYAKTESYIHLSYEERRAFIAQVATCISN
jgi:hypothetical protein